MQSEIISYSAAETKNIGKIFAQSLRRGLVVCLQGDLGGGKTTFAQGVAQGLCIKAQITSPSFVLMRRYRICHCEDRSQQAEATKQSHLQVKINYLYHLDCYRLKKAEEILAIGLEEILADPTGVILIEWAERILEYLPQQRITVQFDFLDQKKRKIIFKTKL